MERRKLLKLSASSAILSSLPLTMLPMLSFGEEEIKFTDLPDGFMRGPAKPDAMHFQDIRKISRYSSNEDFYVVQHYGQPKISIEDYSLSITGLVDRPRDFSLEDILNQKSVTLEAGFECGGNTARMFHGLVGNAVWRGARLVDVLKECGIKDKATEVVFFSGDKGTEKIRGKELEQSFSRSLSIQDAMNQDILLAYEMNGKPLSQIHGKPLRLIVPGWYGVTNVKWLNQIHFQDRRHMGRFMARDYVTLKQEKIGSIHRWVESSVAKMNLKSVIARVTKNGASFKVLGFALNDGTPLKKIEVKVDNGPWELAEIDPSATKYGWKLFTFDWKQPTTGSHTITSRATDIDGNSQPTMEELPEKITYWEDFSQFPRTVQI